MGALDDMTNEPGVSEEMRELKKTYLTQSSGTLNLADLAGFSDDELNACYAMACQKIAVGDLDEAMKLFLLLCLLAATIAASRPGGRHPISFSDGLI